MGWESGEKNYTGVKRSLFSQVDKAVKPWDQSPWVWNPEPSRLCNLVLPSCNFKLVSSLQEGSLTYPALRTNAPV